jgi:hypothetical protein
MNMFCLSTNINKYLKSREESLEKIVIHKIKRSGDFWFFDPNLDMPQTQISKRFGFEFGFGACLVIFNPILSDFLV